MGTLRQYAKNAGLLTAQAVVQRGLGVVASAVLARALGPAGMGVYNVVATTPGTAFGLLKLGVDTAVHVNMAEHERAQGVSRGGVLAAGLLLLGGLGALATALCAALAGPIARVVFGQPELAPWLRVASVLVAAQFGFQFCLSALAGLHQFARYARVGMVTGVVNLALVSLGVATAGLAGAVAATAVTGLITVGWLALALRRSLREAGVRLAFAEAPRAAREVLGLGLPFYLTGLVAVPVTYYLQGRLAQSGGLEALGQLRIVLTLTALIWFVPASIGAATVSALSAARTGPGEGGAAFLRQAVLNLKVVWVGCLLLALAACAFLPWLLPLLFGSAYAAAVGPARLGLLGAVLAAAEGVVGQVLFTQRRTWTLFGLLTSRAALFAVLGLALVGPFGLGGYVAAEAAGFAFAVALALPLLARSARTLVPDGPAGALRPVYVAALLNLAVGAGAGGLALTGAGRGWSAVGFAAAFVTVAVLAYRFVLDEQEREALGRALVAFRRRTPQAVAK